MLGDNMNSFEQLNYFVKHYAMGEYTAWDFTSLFTEIYYIKPDDSLTEEYKEYFLPLAECCERFSPYKEDLELPDSPFKNKDELDRIVKKYYSED